MRQFEVPTSKLGVVEWLLPFPCTNCWGELCDAGDAELDVFEFPADVSESDSGSTESTGFTGGSAGEGDRVFGSDGWSGKQMYQAKEFLSRKTLNFSLCLFSLLSDSRPSLVTR